MVQGCVAEPSIARITERLRSQVKGLTLPAGAVKCRPRSNLRRDDTGVADFHGEEAQSPDEKRH
jgi:hypothetical protein